VFVAPEGGPVGYSNWHRRVWVPATKAAGLPGLRLHDLRKGAATAMVTAGVDVRTAQVRLGHSDPG
jgi:integrase